MPCKLFAIFRYYLLIRLVLNDKDSSHGTKIWGEKIDWKTLLKTSSGKQEEEQNKNKCINCLIACSTECLFPSL